MQAVGTKDTGPELAVRRLLHSHGYRYRLHQDGLPGHPDIVFPSRRKVVFVHGCFWHGHTCHKGSLPKTRIDYWEPKLVANHARDVRTALQLRALGWEVLTVWQCEIRNLDKLTRKLVRFLDGKLGKRNATAKKPVGGDVA